MTDREKLTAIVGTFCDRWRETGRSLYIYDSRTKIIFTPEGEIKTIIKDRMAFSPDGQREPNPHYVGITEDSGF